MPEPLPARFSEPPVVEPDPSLERPQIVPWEFFTLRGEREIGVVFPRGVTTGLHSVDVAERADAVIVTVRVGTLPGVDPAGIYPAVAILETAAVRLDAPLGDRHLLDGAP